MHHTALDLAKAIKSFIKHFIHERMECVNSTVVVTLKQAH